MKDVKLGLALGAGGAKGMAHIGFLEVLAANNIKIDYITGSSMGALIGSMYCLGIGFDIMKNRFTNMQQKSVMDFDILFFKRLSVAKGKKVEELINQLLGETTFEDCYIPFACTAVDLIKGEGVVLNEGFLSDAVLASCSIPSAFPPVECGDRLLVDGGAYDRVPVGACFDLGATVVIGVDVVGKPAVLKESPKSFVTVATRTFEIMEYYLTLLKGTKADLMITIQQDNVKSMVVKNLKESYQMGKLAALKNLEKIKKLINKK